MEEHDENDLGETMSMIDRYRARRAYVRRSRAIQRALHSAPSQTLREELLAIANRYE